MEIRDYNGTGEWSVESILERYRDYCRQLGTVPDETLAPKRSTQADVTWIYPVMDEIVAGIERGDKSCIMIGIEFVEQDQKCAFGRRLKSNTARALRRAELSLDQMERLRARVVGMLLTGHIPHEFTEYYKLLRRIGVGAWWPVVEQQVDRQNPYVMRFYKNLREHAKS